MNLEKFFEKDGYVKVLGDKDSLEYLRNSLIDNILKIAKIKFPKNITKEDFLNNFHKYIKNKNLNEVRFSCYNKLNLDLQFQDCYYQSCKKYLDDIVGNELAMQKKINLSIQIPNDKNSLLDMHSDIYAGESPFQVVVWIPMVNVYKTKAMFFADPKTSIKLNHDILNSNKNTIKQLYYKNKNKFKFLDAKFGEIIIFSPIILHGNTINITNESRFSLNCRFKSLLSPYDVTVKSHRNIPNFYRPLTIKPMTKIGFNYLKKYSV